MVLDAFSEARVEKVQRTKKLNINLKLLIVVIVVALVAIGFGSAKLASNNKPIPTGISSIPPTVAPVTIPTSTPTTTPAPTLTATPNPTPEKIFFPGAMGIFLLSGDNPDTYEIGYEAFRGRTTKYPIFVFPLLVSSSTNNVDKVFGTIPDPNLEIGNSCESTFTNPDYPNHLVKVKIARVAEEYRYTVTSSVSLDNGKSWIGPLIYPFEIMLNNKNTK